MDVSETKLELQELLKALDGVDPEVLEGNGAREALAAFEVAAKGLFIWLTQSNPQQIVCDMPYNRHSFLQKLKSKTCTRCGNTYCMAHSLLQCVSCGNTL